MTPIPQSLVSLGSYLSSGGLFGSAPAAHCRSTGGKFSRISSRRAAGRRCRRGRYACPRGCTATRAAEASAARGSPGQRDPCQEPGLCQARGSGAGPAVHGAAPALTCRSTGARSQRRKPTGPRCHGAPPSPSPVPDSSSRLPPSPRGLARPVSSRLSTACGETVHGHTMGTRSKHPLQVMSCSQLCHVCHK